MKFSSHFIYNQLYIKNGSAFTVSNYKSPQVIIMSFLQQYPV